MTLHRRFRAISHSPAVTILLVVSVFPAFAQDADATRQDTLDQLRRVLPESEAWEQWLEESGELPPDFDAMPSIPLLPDPLMWNEGTPEARPVKDADEWLQRREAILEQLEHWILGTVPPRPDNLTVTVLSETEEPSAIVREVELHFGPGDQAKLWCRLYIPQGDGPFPVFMTQENHNAWGLIALSRGYLVCVYAGADSRDDTDTFLPAYPEYDWSRLMRRAWAAGRCIDYLETVPQANPDQIAITGHSRNGKQSLMAAAIDERIDVVISSSSGAGGPLATRYYSEQHFGEGIENITRVFPEWFHPRWRFFVGREDKLPVDMHELVALCAPRPCLLSTAINDGVESTWAMEQTYHSAKKVYTFLGAETDALRILYRPAGHETWPTVIERYLDFCDLHFGRDIVDMSLQTYRPQDERDNSFPVRIIHPHNWKRWSRQARNVPTPEGDPVQLMTDVLKMADGSSISQAAQWPAKVAEVRRAVSDVLGTEPPGAKNPGGSYGEEPDHIEQQLGRSEAGEGIQKDDRVFGEYINGDVYVPDTVDLDSKDGQQVPVILWLHPAHEAHGYNAAYRRGEQCYRTFARAGYAVFCFDQIGFGRRVEEVERFYTRHPDWSLMGNMVRDARAALDEIERLPYADPDRIYVIGYAMGAMVAEHLAIYDDRPAGYALVCGPQPFRCDTPDRRLGGIARWYDLTMRIPRLGYYDGYENRIPYDRHLLLAAMAPRPVCVITPQLDREVDGEDVTAAVEAARKAYGLFEASGRITQLTPEQYNNFGPEMQELVVEWLKSLDGT